MAGSLVCRYVRPIPGGGGNENPYYSQKGKEKRLSESGLSLGTSSEWSPLVSEPGPALGVRREAPHRCGWIWADASIRHTPLASRAKNRVLAIFIRANSPMKNIPQLVVAAVAVLPPIFFMLQSL